MFYLLPKSGTSFFSSTAVCVVALMLSFVFGCEHRPGTSHLTVINAKNGETLWSRNFPVQSVEPSLGDAEDVLKVTYYDQCLDKNKYVTFDMYSGDKLRETSSPWVSSSGSAGGGEVFPRNCPTKRGFILGYPKETEPYQVCLYVEPKGYGAFFMVREDTGAEIMRRNVGEATEILFVDEHLLFIEYDGDLEVAPSKRLDWISLEDGQTEWTFSTPGSFADVLGSLEGDVFIWHEVGESYVDQSGTITAINEDDGKVNWHVDISCMEASLVGSVVTCNITTRSSECDDSD
jgi:outer membrane protein assembly factor BamB